MKKLFNIALVSVAFISTASYADESIVYKFDQAVATCDNAFYDAHKISNAITPGDKTLVEKCKEAYEPAQYACDKAMAAFKLDLIAFQAKK